jgi:glycosyltransferase involved in cell wall biosynthesis
MKISVLIAAYRAESTIGRAIASVRAQTHRDWELVVVEDGSHDGTEAMVRAAAAAGGQSIRYHNLGTNQGVAAARNRLMQLATGGALAFLDADDWWSEDHLARGASRLATGAGIVATGVRAFDLATQRLLGDSRPPAELETDPVGTLFDESVIITSSSVLLSRRAQLQTGEFDTRFSVGEDRDYWLRAALVGAALKIEPAVTCRYARHAGSTMGRTLLVSAQIVRFYEKYFHLAAVPAARRRRLLARSLTNEGRLLRATDARASARQLWRAWCLTPGNVALVPHLTFSGSRMLFGA